MKIAAFDLSLTQTGFAVADVAGGPYSATATARNSVGTIRARATGPARLAIIRDEVLRLSAGAALVIVEEYAYGSGQGAHQLGELGGVVRLALHERHGIRPGPAFVEINPSTLKKYATGKGNAGKEMMLAEAIRRLGYSGSNNNEADALWLLHAAADRHDAGWVKLPQGQRDALDKVNWRGK